WMRHPVVAERPYLASSDRYGALEIGPSERGAYLSHALEASSNPWRSAQDTRLKNERVEALLTSGDGHWIWKTQDEPACPAGREEKRLPGLVPYQDDPQALPALKDFVVDAGRHGIRVVFIRIPLSRTWESSTNAALAYTRMNNVLDEAMRGQSHVSLVGDVDHTFRDQPGIFHDWTHLSMCGARQYTQFLVSAFP
ncbi:MAG: hypothetical protein HY042_07960, partial [Spirochaetia bacterium]|nr:hypothetical protein [Spirochaetia bacterium]